MAKKEKEQEMEIEQNSQPIKKQTKAVRWFNEFAVNNPEELKIISDETARAVAEQFNIVLTNSRNTETFALIFYVTFISILEFIREKQNSYKNFTFEVCKSINIGYVNNDDENNEKVGNFMPIMEYIGINTTIVNNISDDDPKKTEKGYMMWKNDNVKKNQDYLHDISNRAATRLFKDYAVELGTPEAIIPFFCIFMDNIVFLAKHKYEEAKDTNISEVSINVFGLFDIFYSLDEEGGEIIDFVPSIAVKLALKSDENSYIEQN